MIYGESFSISKKSKKWLKIKIKEDNYKGYILNKKYSNFLRPTHKIISLKAKIFKFPNRVKKNEITFGSKIKVIDNNNTSVFLDINNIVSSSADPLPGYTSELGLLGLAFHPDYANNGYFFVNYTDNSQNTQISRFSVDAANPNLADVNSEVLIINIDQPYSNHNGGGVEFGPDG